MHIDPSGESFTLVTLMIIGLALLLTFTLIACTDPTHNTHENITVNAGYSADPLGAGASVFGLGAYIAFNVPGRRIDLEGNTEETYVTMGNLAAFNFSYTSSETSNELSMGVSIFYLSFDTNDLSDFESYGAGVSIGGEIGNGATGYASLDIDFLQIVYDLFRE